MLFLDHCTASLIIIYTAALSSLKVQQKEDNVCPPPSAYPE
jgi:hypothetical protein